MQSGLYLHHQNDVQRVVSTGSSVSLRGVHPTKQSFKDRFGCTRDDTKVFPRNFLREVFSDIVTFYYGSQTSYRRHPERSEGSHFEILRRFAPQNDAQKE